MRYTDLLEYQTYDKKKFIARWNSENNPYESEIGADGENFQDWLEKYDPTPNNKYVNWLTVRYLKSDIKRLEDIPSRIGPALEKYLRLQQKKKLKPEHKNLNSIRNIEDVMDEYQEAGQSNRQQAKSEEQQFYDTNGAKLLHNTSEYKVVIPKTAEASCFFGKNTRWCTAARNNNQFHRYAKKGDLYIILHKPTNRRWQFHFEAEEFVNERDTTIKTGAFYIEHPEITKLFVKLNKLSKFTVNDSGYIIGDTYYNKRGQKHRLDGPAVDRANGDKEWFRNGRFHREDGPAVEKANGDKEWYKNGQRHREDGPAVEHTNGYKAWYRKGKKHREDGPAEIFTNGDEYWYLNGQRHREDGPAVEKADGHKAWLRNGLLHREDGPAVEYSDGDKIWYKNGQRHRENGPAYEGADGTKVWYLNDNRYSSFSRWLRAVDVSDEQKTALKRKYERK